MGVGAHRARGVFAVMGGRGAATDLCAGSCGCCNNEPQPGGLQATETSPLPGPEGQGQGVSRAVLPLNAGTVLLYLLPAARGCPKFLAHGCITATPVSVFFSFFFFSFFFFAFLGQHFLPEMGEGCRADPAGRERPGVGTCRPQKELWPTNTQTQGPHVPFP